MSSNNNWVCFKCRMAKRQPKSVVRVPRCLDCDSEMFCLGYKVKVPACDATDAWKKLWNDCSEREHQKGVQEAKNRVRRIHETEREICKLQSFQENPARNRLIAKLEKRTQ